MKDTAYRVGITLAIVLSACAMVLGLNNHQTVENTSSGGINVSDIQNSIVHVTSGKEHGSGVWVSPTEILTAKHVAQEPFAIRISDNEGGFGSGKVVESPADADLVRVRVTGISPKHVAETAESSAGSVIAAGFPYGMRSLMISEGLTTGEKTTSLMPGNLIPQAEWVLFSAPINPGMSGGGVFNDAGRLVGIISWRADTKDGRDVQQMSYYAPVEKLQAQ